MPATKNLSISHRLTKQLEEAERQAGRLAVLKEDTAEAELWDAQIPLQFFNKVMFVLTNICYLLKIIFDTTLGSTTMLNLALPSRKSAVERLFHNENTKCHAKSQLYF